MNAEAIICLLLYNLHDCTFNVQVISSSLSYDLALRSNTVFAIYEQNEKINTFRF